MDKKKIRQMLINEQRTLVDEAKAAQRDLSEDEKAKYDELQRAIDTLTAEIEAEERKLQEPKEPDVPAPDDSTRAVEAERARITAINALERDFNMDLSQYVRNGATLDTVREAVIEQQRQAAAPLPARGVSIVDEGDKFRAAAADALVMKSGMDVKNPAEGARELIGMSLRDIAIESLEMEGQAGLNRKSSEDIYDLVARQFYNPTAAFPAILDNAINKAYVEGHRSVAVTFDRWTKKGSLKDFKTNDNNYLAGPAGEFLEVPEGGEIKHDVFKDDKRPTRKLKTYGRQFSLTRQAFINDDIDLITRMPAKYAASARKTINKQCVQILMNNPAIYDGTPLFGAKHGNLVKTGTGITQASMRSMILALQNQLDEFGEAIIIRPAILLVPAGMAFDTYTLFNSPTINTEGNTQAVNPLFRYATSIEIIEEPTINVLAGGFGNVMPWFLIANKDDTDFIEVDYLNGQEIPTVRRMETSGQLGFVYDFYLDWGVNVMDFRGAVKNPGIEIDNDITKED